MLNELLHLDRPLFIIDIEATSLDVKDARIVEIAFQRWEAAGMTKEWQTRINPEIPIPASASRVHGIFDADVADKPTFKQLAANLAIGFSDCSYGGQNCRYDLLVIHAEMTRAGQPWSYADARIIDSSRLEALAVPRSLSHLHEKYVGLPHDGAHGALSDVRAAATVIMKQLETYPNLPRTPDKLHDASWPNQADMTGKFRLDADGTLRFNFGKHRGTDVRDVPKGYVDWFMGGDFPPDAKALLVKHR